MGSEQIFATEVEDHALANSIALPIVLDQAEVSVGAGLGLAEERGSLFIHHKYRDRTSSMSEQKRSVITKYLSLHFLTRSKTD
jgi:hypothetical protein